MPKTQVATNIYEIFLFFSLLLYMSSDQPKPMARTSDTTCLYSNMSCAPTNKQQHAPTRNRMPSPLGMSTQGTWKFRSDTPEIVPNNSSTKNRAPSVPITNPTRLATIIMTIFKTAPRAATCLCQGSLLNWGYIRNAKVRIERKERKKNRNGNAMYLRCRE